MLGSLMLAANVASAGQLGVGLLGATAVSSRRVFYYASHDAAGVPYENIQDYEQFDRSLTAFSAGGGLELSYGGHRSPLRASLRFHVDHTWRLSSTPRPTRIDRPSISSGIWSAAVPRSAALSWDAARVSRRAISRPALRVGLCRGGSGHGFVGAWVCGARGTGVRLAIRSSTVVVRRSRLSRHGNHPRMDKSIWRHPRPSRLRQLS